MSDLNIRRNLNGEDKNTNTKRCPRSYVCKD